MLLISDSAIEMAISMFKGSCQSLQLQQVRVLRRTCEVGNKKTHRLVMVEANSYFLLFSLILFFLLSLTYYSELKSLRGKKSPHKSHISKTKFPQKSTCS